MPSVRTVCLVEANENFENGLALGWSNFTSVNSRYRSYLSKFLGPFERAQQPKKTFVLSPATANVRVTFDFYQIDSWDGGSFPHGPDRFKVFVNSYLVDLGFFTKEVSDNGVRTGTAVDGGIRWKREYIDSSNINTNVFGESVDERHKVTIDISERLVEPSGTLTLQFFADVSEGNLNEPAGIDNLRILSCPRNVPFPFE